MFGSESGVFGLEVRLGGSWRGVFGLEVRLARVWFAPILVAVSTFWQLSDFCAHTYNCFKLADLGQAAHQNSAGCIA